MLAIDTFGIFQSIIGFCLQIPVAIIGGLCFQTAWVRTLGLLERWPCICAPSHIINTPVWAKLMTPVWPNQPVPTPRLPNMPSAAFAYALSLHHSIIAPFGSLASIDVGGNQENVLAQGINLRDDLLIFHLGSIVIYICVHEDLCVYVYIYMYVLVYTHT